MKDKNVKGCGWAWASPDRYGLLKDFAKGNRREMTPAEQVLWNAIRYKSLGVSFRRQVVIGDYIADFACLAHKLIIEVDGGYHTLPEQEKEDEVRTQVLLRLGFRVIRFTNEEVMFNIEDVLEKIRAEIRKALPFEAWLEALPSEAGSEAPPSEANFVTSVSLPEREGEIAENDKEYK